MSALRHHAQLAAGLDRVAHLDALVATARSPRAWRAAGCRTRARRGGRPAARPRCRRPPRPAPPRRMASRITELDPPRRLAIAWKNSGGRLVRAGREGGRGAAHRDPSPPARPRHAAEARRRLAHAPRRSGRPRRRQRAGALLGRLEPPDGGIRPAGAGLTKLKVRLRPVFPGRSARQTLHRVSPVLFTIPVDGSRMARMAGKVHELRPKAGNSEKITINLGLRRPWPDRPLGRGGVLLEPHRLHPYGDPRAARPAWRGGQAIRGAAAARPGPASLHPCRSRGGHRRPARRFTSRSSASRSSRPTSRPNSRARRSPPSTCWARCQALRRGQGGAGDRIR